MYQQDPIFVKPVTLAIQDIPVSGFCYYDLKREQTERNLFYIHLHDLKAKLESSRIPGWRRPEKVFKERAGKMANYFSWQVVDDRFQVEIRKNTVSQRVNRMGKQIILAHSSLDWQECLTVYRERDAVEKAFRTVKDNQVAVGKAKAPEEGAYMDRMQILALRKDAKLCVPDGGEYTATILGRHN